METLILFSSARNLISVWLRYLVVGTVFCFVGILYATFEAYGFSSPVWLGLFLAVGVGLATIVWPLPIKVRAPSPLPVTEETTAKFLETYSHPKFIFDARISTANAAQVAGVFAVWPMTLTGMGMNSSAFGTNLDGAVVIERRDIDRWVDQHAFIGHISVRSRRDEILLVGSEA